MLEQLYSIVNERWQDQRSIVVTTNITDLEQLREELGPRTVSRLTEICGEPIPIMGPDLRIPPMRCGLSAGDGEPGFLDSLRCREW